MNEQAVVLRHYDKTTIKHLDVISGISPYAMRRVFGGWILTINLNKRRLTDVSFVSRYVGLRQRRQLRG